MLSIIETVFKISNSFTIDGIPFCRTAARPFLFLMLHRFYPRRKIIPILSLIFVTFLLFHSTILYADSATPVGVITVKRIRMHAEPKINAPVLKNITKGATILILDHKGSWIHINHEGQSGFIQKQKKPVFVLLKSNKASVTEKENKRKIEKFKKEAKEINQKIKKRKAEIQSIKQKERSVLSNLNEIDLSLNRSKKLASLIKTDLVKLSKRITATRNATKALEQKIQTNEKYAAKRLVALYKLNWLGKIHMIASADSMDEILQRKTYLEHILEHDQKTLNQLIENKNQHTKLLKKLKNQQREKLSLEKDYKNQINIAANRKTERKNLLSNIRNKKSLQIASIKALQKASVELDRTIQSLTRQIERSRTSSNITKKSFSAFKGLLKMPVKGKIITQFGPYRNNQLNVMNYRNGIDIKAEKGEPIKAVMAGNVIFSNWFKGYGNMIILDHGNRYYTVYAHAEEIFKQKGQYVEAEEIIAVVGDTGSLIGPELYFEIRHKDKPVDPLKWLNVKK